MIVDRVHRSVKKLSVEKSPASRQATKQSEVARAATGVFLRYGYARTTMGDIATAMGVSRPALYLVFPSKEEVFAAVIHQMDAEWHVEMRAALLAQPTLEAKLSFACEKWGTHGFDIVAAHPDAKDLFDLNFAPVREVYGRFQELIAEIIAEAVVTSGIHATAPELARTLVFAMRGFKYTATSFADMRRLIALQVSLLIAALNTHHGRK